MRLNYLLCLALVSGGLCGCVTGGPEGKARNGPGPYLYQGSSFNGKQLLLGDSLWDAVTGKELKRLGVERPRFVTATRFSPDGKRAFTATAREGPPEMLLGDAAVFWDVATGQEIQRLSPDAGNSFGYVTDFQFSPDGNRLLMVCEGVGNLLAIQIWDVNSWKRLLIVPGLWLAVNGPPTAPFVSFSPDGRRLFVLSYRKITILDSFTGREICAIAPKEESAKPDFYVSAEFSADGKLVLTQQCNGIAEIWDAATGRQLKVLGTAREYDQFPPPALFTPDGRGVISGAENGVVTLYDVESGREIRRFQIPGIGRGSDDKMIISRDGKRLIVVSAFTDKITGGGGVRGSTALLDLESGRVLKQSIGEPGAGERESVVGFSPVDETFITIHDRKPSALWDGATGRMIRDYK